MKLFSIFIIFCSIQTLAESISTLKTKGSTAYLYKGKEIKISKGMKLELGGIIKTETTNSYVDFKFEDGNTVRISGGSSKVLENLKQSDPNGLQIISGKLFAYVRNSMPKKKTKYKLKVFSKSAVAGVRGTKFFIEEKNDDKKTYFCVCKGSLEVTNLNDSTDSISLGKFQDLWNKHNQKLGKKSEARKDMIEIATENFADMGFPL